MNKLGFGFLRLPSRESSYDWEQINDMVDRFLALGGRYFDTCYTYLDGQSEEAIRRCLVARKPRESFELAEKLPGYLCRSYEDCGRFFNEELTRCGVDFFDVFMLHWLNGNNYRTAEALDEFRFLREVKEQGLARRIGFSYHDNAQLLEQILSAHPEVEIVQLQINYLDWDTAGIESRKCYETCVRFGKKVIVMEPLKGGTLAALPEAAEAVLRARHADRSPADWALSFVQSLPEVEVCLSGMSSLFQVEQNMKAFEPLSPEETELLFSICPVIHGKTAIACTGCRYCQAHCPRHIAIPDYFRMYNELSRYPEDDWKIRPSYQQTAIHHGKASDCIRCRRCEAHCPQRLPIADTMASVAALLE